MSDEIKKMELSEAYSLVRSMSNAFKAFKDAEDVILAAMQAREEMNRATKSIELLKAEEQGAIAEADAANVTRDNAVDAKKAAEGDLEAAKVSIAATVASAATHAEERIKAAQAEADEAIARIKSGIDKASEDALTYKAEAVAIIAGVDAEIAAKRESLAALQSEIDALKQKFA
jgi:hypothetical protein